MACGSLEVFSLAFRVPSHVNRKFNGAQSDYFFTDLFLSKERDAFCLRMLPVRPVTYKCGECDIIPMQ